MSKILSFAWLALAIGIAITSVIDMGETHWRLSWLVFDWAAVMMACGCFFVLYFGAGRAAGIAIAALFVVYCLYLFALSFPPLVNIASLLNVALFVLGVGTIALLASKKKL